MNITADGTYAINKFNGVSKKNSPTSIVYLSGSLGGGTATLKYGDGDNMIPLSDGLLSVGEQYTIEHGTDMSIFLVIAGSTTPDLNLLVTGKS